MEHGTQKFTTSPFRITMTRPKLTYLAGYCNGHDISLSCKMWKLPQTKDKYGPTKLVWVSQTAFCTISLSFNTHNLSRYLSTLNPLLLYFTISLSCHGILYSLWVAYLKKETQNTKANSQPRDRNSQLWNVRIIYKLLSPLADVDKANGKEALGVLELDESLVFSLLILSRSEKKEFTQQLV